MRQRHQELANPLERNLARADRVMPVDAVAGVGHVHRMQTRRDGTEVLRIAPQVPVKTAVEIFGLAQANEALQRLREGRITGAAVLAP